MKEINISTTDANTSMGSIVSLTLGRMLTAGYKLIDIDKPIENAVEIKVDTFDDYMRLINDAGVKFIYTYKYSGLEKSISNLEDLVKKHRALNKLSKYKEIYDDLSKEYSNKYINLYTNIGGIITVVKLSFTNVDVIGEFLKRLLGTTNI